MKKALAIYGGWPGHQPEDFAKWTNIYLQQEGFRVALSNTLEVLLETDLTKFDLIVPIWTMGKISEQQEHALSAAIKTGVGLAGWHGGMGDAFRSSTLYQFMVGGQFVSHPGNVRSYEVNIALPDDPIMKGIRDFSVTSEQYYLHVDPSNEVLATTTFLGGDHPWISGCVMPVVWKRAWGKGKVFYCSIGHTVADFGVPEVSAIVKRGLLWASR